MNKAETPNKKLLSNAKLPDSPGVYFFLGDRRQILYIGRATSLKDRVKSYFSSDLLETRGPQIVDMVAKAKKIDFRKTDSVLEAIILEADLIKKFQPAHNTREKDDKSFNCVVITDEDFPQVLIIRKRDIDFPQLKTNNYKLKTVFGPFTSGTHLKDALKIIRRIFPYHDGKCVPLQGKPCFNRQIGLCPGVCTGEISQKEYGKIVSNIELFFSGKKNQIIKKLELEMKGYAKKREFERAQQVKTTIFALKHIQDISLVNSGDNSISKTSDFRIEAYDVAHISGTDVVGVMTVVEEGFPKKSDYRKFKIIGGFGNNDVASLKEVIERRLNHTEWPLPKLIVADGSDVQKNTIEEVLRKGGLNIPVVAVTKNERHRPEKIIGDDKLVREFEKSILLANSEAHRFAITFHRARRDSRYSF